jgi:antitoxin HigA-1
MKRKMKPLHPGIILREDVLKEMDLSVTKAAIGLEISRKQLSEIVNENASISAEMAVRLEQRFGISAEFWLDLQKKYDIWKVQNSGRVHLNRIVKGPAILAVPQL